MSGVFDLTDKKVWVLGGAGHLGTCITSALDLAGARVLCVDLPGKAVSLLDREGLSRTQAADLDLLELEKLECSLNELAREHGVPGAVVNLVAASSRSKPLEELSSEDLEQSFEGNQTAAFLIGRTIAQLMKPAGGGSIVFFASMYGMVAPDPRAYHTPLTPNPIDYGSAKAGLLQIMRYLAVYYGPDNIRFNCVTPGAFPSAAYRSASPKTAEALQRRIPMARFGNPEEIIGPTLFLVSNASSYVTGHSLLVDGGWTAW